MGSVAFLLDGKGVHVGAYADGAGARATGERTHNAGASKTAVNRQAALAQLRGNEICRPVFVASELRMPVKMVPPRDSLGDEIGRESSW